jgi:hypothetical protein
MPDEAGDFRMIIVNGVQHRDRGQRAVGVLAEILVAGRVEQVEGEPLMLEAHHRRRHRDAALALDRHPIRAHPPPLAPRLRFARQQNRPGKQQQFLGQGGLAGILVRNDCESAPARNLVGQGSLKTLYPAADWVKRLTSPAHQSLLSRVSFC